jgi:hypothetical protein
MTYCAALRVNGVVHLIADSAVTSDQVAEPAEKETPFGEPYAANQGRLTEDGATKIFEFDGDAFTFAGSVKSGIAFLRHYRKHRQNQISRKSSFELALVDLASLADFTVLGVLGEADEMIILKGAPQRHDPEVQTVEEFCSIGANAEVRTLFDRRLLAVTTEWGAQTSPSSCLAMLTATGIATSVKAGTFSRYGVGGAFNGITLSRKKTSWQEDHLVFVFKQDPGADHSIATICNRNDWVIVRYNVGERAVGGRSIVTPFGQNMTSPEELEALRREKEAVLHESLYPVKSGKFSHISLISQTAGHAHVFDMQRKPRTRLVGITPPAIYSGVVSYGISIRESVRYHFADPSNTDKSCFEAFQPAANRRELRGL